MNLPFDPLDPSAPLIDPDKVADYVGVHNEGLVGRRKGNNQKVIIGTDGRAIRREINSQDEEDAAAADAAEGSTPEEYYARITSETDRIYASQPKADISSIWSPAALEYYIDHCADFIEDTFRYKKNGELLPIKLQPWQREVCDCVSDHKRRFASISAGSGVGKSWLLSKIINWFLITREGKVPCTAPTEQQLFLVLWSELKKDWDNNPVLQQVFQWTQTKYFVRGHVATWFAVARTATVRKDGKVQEGLQGFHDDNLMYVLDEASGIADSSMAAVDGALTAQNAIVIMTSNPTKLYGRFYNSHHKTNREKGGPWDIWKIDCNDCDYVSQEYINYMRLEHGEDSAVYKAKVTGQFPDQEENTLISMSDFNYAMTGVSKSRLFTSADILHPGTARELEYQSDVFASKMHEMMALRFAAIAGYPVEGVDANSLIRGRLAVQKQAAEMSTVRSSLANPIRIGVLVPKNAAAVAAAASAATVTA